jgi:hypothetical protein
MPVAFGIGVPEPQIEAGHLGREGIHLAQLLAGMLGADPDRREDGR